MYYIVKIPWIIRKIAPSLVYRIPNDNKTVFLTFDDGPIPETTPEILEILKDYNAKATFFCVGKNVEKHPDLFSLIKKKGHSVGSHSFTHKDGWKTKNIDYFKDIKQAHNLIKTKLFRPPYGRIRPSQIKYLKKRYKIVMWDVLSGDFDQNTSMEKCVSNVVNNIASGSIIVFHDNLKSKDKVLKVLPEVLKILTREGYKFEKIVL